MKITLATSSFQGGGITSYAHELIKHYSQTDDLSVIVGDDSYSPICEGVEVYYCDCNDLSLSNLTKILFLINEEIHPDVLICSFTKCIAVIIPHLNDNIKVVTVSHSLKFIESDIAAFNNKYIDSIIALSNFNKLALIKHFKIKDRDKISVIYNFVSSLENAELIRYNKLKSDDVIIVFPGGTAPPKSPELVLQVLEGLLQTSLNFKFYWLANTQIPFRRFLPAKDIRNIVNRDPRVIITGKLPRNEAEQIISSADVLLSPSRREGCPMSLLEAMRVGCIPIIADFKHASLELIKNGQNGFVIERKNIKEYIEILTKIIESKYSFRHIYEESYNTFASYASYDVWKKKMDNLIYSTEYKHKKRGKYISKYMLLKDIIRIKCLEKTDVLLKLLEENIPVAISLNKQKIMNGRNTISDRLLYKYISSYIHRLFVILTPRLEMMRCYRKVFKKFPNFKKPHNLVEKIYWLQLNTDTSLWTYCADKFLMRDFVIKNGCGDFLPKLFGHWESVDEIDFSILPENCILKTNNACGQCVIIKSGEAINQNSIKNTFRKWMKIPFGYSGAELHYLKIKPLIIAEELLLQTGDEKIISPNSLIDYKVWCFNGKPYCIFVAYNRLPSSLGIALYDTTWNPMGDKLNPNSHYRYNPHVAIPKPKCLDQILQISTTLSRKFKEVRVDFYIIDNKPIVGEMTFTSGFGYFTKEFYDEMGQQIQL